MPGRESTTKKSVIEATAGLDILKGTFFPDTFQFKFTDDNNPKNDTLNDNDRIQGYEYGEVIRIDGIALEDARVDAEYDKATNQYKLKIDTDGDGKSDVTVALDGISYGDLVVTADKEKNTTTIVLKDDPAELGDGEEILLIKDETGDTRFDAGADHFAFSAEPDLDFGAGETAIYTDYDFF